MNARIKTETLTSRILEICGISVAEWIAAVAEELEEQAAGAEITDAAVSACVGKHLRVLGLEA